MEDFTKRRRTAKRRLFYNNNTDNLSNYSIIEKAEKKRALVPRKGLKQGRIFRRKQLFNYKGEENSSEEENSWRVTSEKLSEDSKLTENMYMSVWSRAQNFLEWPKACAFRTAENTKKYNSGTMINRGRLGQKTFDVSNTNESNVQVKAFNNQNATSRFNFKEKYMKDKSLGEEADDLTLREENLLWLLNFRIDSIFEIAKQECVVDHDHNYKIHRHFDEASVQKFIPDSKVKTIVNGEKICLTPVDQCTPKPTSRSHECNIGKPPYTYTELIELALKDKGELTVSGIYKWITFHFPFYQDADDRWKNSVRHNLSINPNFKKGNKAQGGSHLWKIIPEEERDFKSSCTAITSRFHWKKRKLDELETKFPHFFGKRIPHEVIRSNRSDEEVLQAVESIRCPKSKVETEDKKHDMPNIYIPFLVQARSPPQKLTISQSVEKFLHGEQEQHVKVEFMTPGRQAHHEYHSLCGYSQYVGGGDASPLCLSWYPHAYISTGQLLNPVSTNEVVQECGLDPVSSQTMQTLPRMPSGSLSEEFEPEPVNGEFFEVLHSWSCDKIGSP